MTALYNPLAAPWTLEDLDPLACLFHQGRQGEELVYNLTTHQGRAAWQEARHDQLRKRVRLLSRRKTRRRSRASLLPSTSLWTVREFAAFLQRSERWVYSALQRDPLRKGSVPFVRLPGGAPRFDPDLVRAWVAQSCPHAAHFQPARKQKGGNL